MPLAFTFWMNNTTQVAGSTALILAGVPSTIFSAWQLDVLPGE
jgi:hypothetical protein